MCPCITSPSSTTCALLGESALMFHPSDKRYPRAIVWFQSVSNTVDKVEDPAKAIENKVFNVCYSKWETTKRQPSGVCKKLLGELGDPVAETKGIILSNNINNETFSSSVLKCLPKTPFVIPEEEIKHRRDFRRSAVISIDPDTAR